jgi:cbb3-type cytochrome oxidase subunit 3
MYRMLLEKSPLLALPLVALFIFIGVFALIVLRTYGRRAETYAPAEALPLADDDHVISNDQNRRGEHDDV